MSLLEQKKDYIKRGTFDELFTPENAIRMILPYIPKDVKTIWECTGIENGNISRVLEEQGYNVINTHIDQDIDFLIKEPDQQYDIIITNPPYSLKDKFLKRAFELNKPFMFLLPLTTLEGKVRGELFNKYAPIQLLIPNKRFNFKSEKNSSAWFQTTWFTHGINLDQQLNFIDIII